MSPNLSEVGTKFPGQATTFVPYLQRSEWADLQPVPQDDGQNPIVPIAYPEEYRAAADMFRAVAGKNELSERALELTWDIIQLNPAHYTVWHYRSEILFALKKDLNKELDLIDELAEENPKCYQLWHHRQVVVERLGDASSRELPFVANMLADDPKNYHAWSYRQWVVRQFNLWDKELDYVNGLLELDIRNNSAWNHRFYILKSGPQGASEDAVDRELQYAFEKIRLAPHNESPWNFLLGIAELVGFAARPEIELFVRQLLKESGGKRISPFLLSTLVDIDTDKIVHGDASLFCEALQLCEQLETREDVIRANYWARRRETIKATVADTRA